MRRIDRFHYGIMNGYYAQHLEKLKITMKQRKRLRQYITDKDTLTVETLEREVPLYFCAKKCGFPIHTCDTSSCDKCWAGKE